MTGGIRGTGLVLTALAAGVLSGCGHPRPESVTPDSGRLSTMAVDMITNSGRYPGQRYLIDEATEKATANCMRTAGVSWSGFAGVAPADSDEDWILQPRDRRRNGYGIVDGATRQNGDASAGDDDPRLMSALVGEHPARATLTLPGLAEYSYPTSGCLARARAEVAGDAATWARLSYLPAELNLRLVAAGGDARYLAAQAAWRRCMAEKHLPYATSGDVRAHVAEQVKTHPDGLTAVRAEEVRLAVQDAECDQSARLSRTELILRREAAQAIAPAQRAAVNRLTPALTAAVNRARAILK